MRRAWLLAWVVGLCLAGGLMVGCRSTEEPPTLPPLVAPSAMPAQPTVAPTPTFFANELSMRADGFADEDRVTSSPNVPEYDWP